MCHGRLKTEGQSPWWESGRNGQAAAENKEDENESASRRGIMCFVLCVGHGRNSKRTDREGIRTPPLFCVFEKSLTFDRQAIILFQILLQATGHDHKYSRVPTDLDDADALGRMPCPYRLIHISHGCTHSSCAKQTK